MAADSTSNRGCLHLVVGGTHEALAACAACLGDDDSVLFLDAGVMHVAGEMKELAGWPGKRHASGPDLEARGLSGVARACDLHVIADDAFPALLAAHELCLTWK